MKLKKVLFSIVIFCLAFFSAAPGLANTAEQNSKNDLENNLGNIYTRYSYYLDKQYNNEFQTWFFAAPTYEIPEWSLAANARHLISLATFYKYRALEQESAAMEKIQAAVKKSILIQQVNAEKHYSFHGAITNFLTIRLIEQIPDLLSAKELKSYQLYLFYHAPRAIKANDTENRAALAAVYWRYVLEYLQDQGFYINAENFELLNHKIDQSIEETLSSDFLYRENQQKDFSMHYHALEAFLLTIYGDWTKNVNYVIYGREMTKNLYNLSFENGHLEAELGKRPAGTNSQTYLMAGLLTKRFKYPDYQAYLYNITGNRFFSDARYKNRLEWHTTFENMPNAYHDDYSFANIAELALVFEGFNNTEFPTQYLKLQNKNTTYSRTYNLTNNGSKITFFDKVKRTVKNLQLSTHGLMTKNF